MLQQYQRQGGFIATHPLLPLRLRLLFLLLSELAAQVKRCVHFWPAYNKHGTTHLYARSLLPMEAILACHFLMHLLLLLVLVVLHLVLALRLHPLAVLLVVVAPQQEMAQLRHSLPHQLCHGPSLRPSFAALWVWVQLLGHHHHHHHHLLERTVSWHAPGQLLHMLLPFLRCHHWLLLLLVLLARM